jgi:mannose-1-phosphate guanylyltransferase
MIDPKLHCVIMAGGIGSRFWPMSRSARPKQFLDVLGLGRTLIQQTYDRFLPLCAKENILVVTSTAYRDLVKEQLPQLMDDQILLEPMRRNTAPCIAYANERILMRDPEAVIVVASSDHLVMEREAFEETIRIAAQQARSGDHLVTLGIMPSRPDTGYGYVQMETVGGVVHPRVKRVKTFTEKPDHATAQRFLESGEFLWNSGIFIWCVQHIMRAFATHLPDMSALFAAGRGKYGTPQESAFIAATYEACENVSIDYGVMEKAKNVLTVMSDFGWSDLGTWGSLFTHLPRDAKGNAVVGDNIKLHDCERNVVRSEDGRLVVLQGLQEFIVVNTPDVLLVCRQHDEQKIKQFVAEATAESGEKYV